jgi:hypothetical protein
MAGWQNQQYPEQQQPYPQQGYPEQQQYPQQGYQQQQQSYPTYAPPPNPGYSQPYAPPPPQGYPPANGEGKGNYDYKIGTTEEYGERFKPKKKWNDLWALILYLAQVRSCSSLRWDGIGG